MNMLSIGDRVEIAPHFDLWMRGARYGVVTKLHKPKYTARNGAALLTPIVSVRLDGRKGAYKFFVTDLRLVFSISAMIDEAVTALCGDATTGSEGKS